MNRKVLNGRTRSRPRQALVAAAAMSVVAGLLTFGSVATAEETSDDVSTARVDNPYDGATVYVNPDWSAKATEGGGSAIADEPTFVWMDRTAAITGTEGARGLREHLDTAVDQGADLFQVVIYNLPGRDCSALASNGELPADAIGRYQTEYIDPIAEILGDSAYADLRIVAIIEIDSLPNLVTNVAPRETQTENCNTMKANGNYQKGVGYALGALGALPNVYNYIDIGHHGWLGWDDNFQPFADLVMSETVNNNGASPEDVHGFVSNVANYGVLHEEHFDANTVVGGKPVREDSDWVDWNRYVDEVSYAKAYGELFSQRFGRPISMLIDTSRNGWGGADRPSGPSSSTDPNTFVEESRIDRRIHTGNWCNQSGAGIGERPTASPEDGIDAFVWVKPPGESDGASEEIPNDEGKGFDEMCDPAYQGNPRNGNNPSGSLGDAPLSGHWFQAQFSELIQNAYPAL
ncbi:glycoside hydrolase family 6 protein [Actinophytocola sediminis]